MGLQSGDTCLQDRRGQKFSATQECQRGVALSKIEAVMLCQSNWAAQQPARETSSVHGRR